MLALPPAARSAKNAKMRRTVAVRGRQVMGTHMDMLPHRPCVLCRATLHRAAPYPSPDRFLLCEDGQWRFADYELLERPPWMGVGAGQAAAEPEGQRQAAGDAAPAATATATA